MRMTLAEIAEVIGGEVIGDSQTVITGISGIKEAQTGDITFLANPKYAPLLSTTGASAVLLDRESKIENCKKPVVRTDDPSFAFAQIVSLVSPQKKVHPQGISKFASIAPGAVLGKDVSIGPFAIIEPNVRVGDNSVIYGGCFIGNSAQIGSDCLLYSHVTIREDVQIGNRVIVHSGTVIGSDGFGFVAVEGSQQKIPQIGIVVIEDDVEIGANVTIDRARFDKTVIGQGTKIDNLVQIAHNVCVGKHCLIVAQAGVSGSTVVGNGAVLAGQAGIVGHIRIGEKAIVAAQAGVTKSVPDHTMVSGYPARPHDTAKRVNACVQKLPELYTRVKELEEEIRKLKEQLSNG